MVHYCLFSLPLVLRSIRPTSTKTTSQCHVIRSCQRKLKKTHTIDTPHQNSPLYTSDDMKPTEIVTNNIIENANNEVYTRNAVSNSYVLKSIYKVESQVVIPHTNSDNATIEISLNKSSSDEHEHEPNTSAIDIDTCYNDPSSKSPLKLSKDSDRSVSQSKDHAKRDYNKRKFLRDSHDNANDNDGLGKRPCPKTLHSPTSVTNLFLKDNSHISENGKVANTSTPTLHTQTVVPSTQTDLSLTDINNLVESIHLLQYQLSSSKSQISQYEDINKHLTGVLNETRTLARNKHEAIFFKLRNFQIFFKSKHRKSSIENSALLNLAIY